MEILIKIQNIYFNENAYKTIISKMLEKLTGLNWFQLGRLTVDIL